MATLRQIQTALGNAQAAGDQAAVVRLSQLLEQAKAAGAPEGGMPMSEVASRAISNAPSSLYNYGSDIASAVMHPIDTIGTMGDLGAGALREGARAVLPAPVFNALDSVGDQEAGQRASATATAVGRHYADRYGSIEGFKRAVAEDPIGVASDLSLPLTGGGGLIAKAGGTVGKLGRVAQVAGEVMDPISAAGKAASGAGKAVSSGIGFLTGVGDEPIRSGFNARRAGGAQADAFNRGMRQAPDGEGLVDQAMRKADVLKQDAQAEYNNGIAASRNSTAQINWNNIFRSISDSIKSMQTRSGRFYGGDASKQMVRNILNTVHQYVSDPSLHNIEGLDALKQELSDLQVTLGPSVTRGQENANRLVTHVLDGIRQEIIRLEPSYAGVMDRYSQFKDLQDELRKTLSLNDKASTDTALRKLQSTMRNNVQANYGQRTSLLDELDSVGRGALQPGTLRAELAGQALNSWMPRGIARAGGAMTIPAGVAWLAGHPGMAGAIAASAPFSMPRVMGEAAGAAGSVAGKIDRGAGKVPAPVRRTVRAAASRPGRQALRQAGVMNDQAQGMIQDAQGRWYDSKGRLIQ